MYNFHSQKQMNVKGSTSRYLKQLKNHKFFLIDAENFIIEIVSFRTIFMHRQFCSVFIQRNEPLHSIIPSIIKIGMEILNFGQYMKSAALQQIQKMDNSFSFNLTSFYENIMHTFLKSSNLISFELINRQKVANNKIHTNSNNQHEN